MNAALSSLNRVMKKDNKKPYEMNDLNDFKTSVEIAFKDMERRYTYLTTSVNKDKTTEDIPHLRNISDAFGFTGDAKGQFIALFIINSYNT
jgi:hypothetical protein